MRTCLNKLLGVILKIGDKDGLGVIYDNFGELILRLGEKTIARAIENIGIITGWKEDGGFVFRLGKGTLFRTNQRFVFIRSPSEANVIIYGAPLTEIPGDLISAKDLRTHNYFEYLEINPKEIIGYKGGFLVSTKICLYFKGKRYGLHFSTKNSNILKGLIQSLPKITRNIETQYYEIPKDRNIPHCDHCQSEDVYYYSEPDGILIPFGLGKCKVCNRVFQWKKKWL